MLSSWSWVSLWVEVCTLYDYLSAVLNETFVKIFWGYTLKEFLKRWRVAENMLREHSQTPDKEWSFRLGVRNGSANPSVQNLACCMKYHGPQITLFGFEYVSEGNYLGDRCMWKVNIEMNLRKI